LYSKKNKKISGLKSKHRISSLQSAERGSLVTVVTFMNPTGHFIPPLRVFPRKKYETRTDEWQTAWINPRMSSIHVDTERDFHPVISSLRQIYTLLVLDGHYSHTRNLEIFTLSRDNHVGITCLPSHSSHKMQPWIKLPWGT